MSNEKKSTNAKMRKIPLRVISKTDKDVGVNYREMFETVLVNPATSGGSTTIAEMRKVQPILDKLDCTSDDDILYLEEGEYKELRDRINKFPFRINSAHLIELADDLKNPEREFFTPTGEIVEDTIDDIDGIEEASDSAS